MTALQLRMALARADISAAELGRRLDVHRGTVTRWTRGLVAIPKDRTEAIDKALR